MENTSVAVRVTTADRLRAESLAEVRGKAVAALRVARMMEQHGSLPAAYAEALDAEAWGAGLPGGALAEAAYRLVQRVRLRMARTRQAIRADGRLRLKVAAEGMWQDEALMRAEYDAWTRSAAREVGMW